MEAGLKEFIEAYAKENNLKIEDVSFLAGALSYKSLEKLDEYKKFVVTLNQVAPHILHYIQLAGKEPEDENS